MTHWELKVSAQRDSVHDIVVAGKILATIHHLAITPFVQGQSPHCWHVQVLDTFYSPIHGIEVHAFTDLHCIKGEEHLPGH
jgi:hypothetical protein